MPKLRHFVGPPWPPTEDAYDYALTLCRSDLAWEFLRRAPAYQRDYQLNFRGQSQAPRCLCASPQLTRIRRKTRAAAAWGLLAFVDPALPAPNSPVCWLASPKVPLLEGLADRSPTERKPDLQVKTLTSARHVLLGPTGEQFVLLRDAHSALTLRLQGARVATTPVNTSILLRGLPDPDLALRSLSILAALILRPSHKPHASRDVLFLRDALVALDGRCIGATYRDMAAAIYGRRQAQEAWSSTSRWMKDRMCRALVKGERLRDGGYRGFLQ
jgi:hypothetical protein